jgi:hypothetical protein
MVNWGCRTCLAHSAQVLYVLFDKRVHRSRSRNIVEGVDMERGYKGFCHCPILARDDWIKSAKDRWERKGYREAGSTVVLSAG